MTVVRRRQAGFTLVEMMVALVVGAVSVVVAAKVAQVVIRQSAQGQQATDFNIRSRLIARQLRADLRSAGYGSTGAVAVDTDRDPWNSGIAIDSVEGKPALSVVTGVNNVGAINIGGVAVQPGSDVVMMVVPNPGISGVTEGWAAVGGTAISLEPHLNDPSLNQPLASCATGLMYAVDHSAPNGAGRAQLMFVEALAGNSLSTVDALQFTLAPGSSVTCARLSTYWLAADGWLHRTDVAPNPDLTSIGATRVFYDANQVGAGDDLIAPGVLDLQIAYRFSAEIYRNGGFDTPPQEDIEAQWAFEGRAANVDAIVAADVRNWFETRRVRFNVLMSTIRSVEPRTFGTKTRPPREDGLEITLRQPMRAEWVTTEEALTNLRYFDYGAPELVSPEPF